MKLSTRPEPKTSQSREKSLVSTPMTLVMVSNLSQKRSFLPKSLPIVRLRLMLPKLILLKLLLRPLLMPLLPLLLLETSLSSEMLASLDLVILVKDSELDSVVETTDGLRSVTTLNSPLLTLQMTPTPTLSPNT